MAVTARCIESSSCGQLDQRWDANPLPPACWHQTQTTLKRAAGFPRPMRWPPVLCYSRPKETDPAAYQEGYRGDGRDRVQIQGPGGGGPSGALGRRGADVDLRLERALV